MNRQPVEVALAILPQNGRFLMQLRDDLPQIAYPGCWGLFGGHLENSETPLEALLRELREEINYPAVEAQLFRSYTDERAIRHVFAVPLMVPVEKLTLQEGQDLALIDPEAIKHGSYYSPKTAQRRHLGAIHREILHDFLNHG